MRRFASSGLVLWMSLAIGCGDKTPPKPTREDCSKVAEHMAELIVEHYATHTDEWWDAEHAEPGETGIPPQVQQSSFKLWLDTPPGRTWMMERRGQTLALTQQRIEQCMQNADRAQVTCLLAAKSKEDVDACDAKRTPTVAAPAGSASTGSAQGGSAGK